MAKKHDREPVFAEASDHRWYGRFTPPDSWWGVNNSPLTRYSSRVYPSSGSDYLARRLQARFGAENGDTALDLAGGRNGRAIRDLLELGIVAKGLVTNYQDRRHRRVRQEERLGHVAGNLLDKSTWEAIENWKNTHSPAGFSLVTHMPVGGLQMLNPGFYSRAARELTRMTAPGGRLILQVPAMLAGIPHETLVSEDCFLKTDPSVEGYQFLSGSKDVPGSARSFIIIDKSS